MENGERLDAARNQQAVDAGLAAHPVGVRPQGSIDEDQRRAASGACDGELAVRRPDVSGVLLLGADVAGDQRVLQRGMKKPACWDVIMPDGQEAKPT